MDELTDTITAVQADAAAALVEPIAPSMKASHADARLFAADSANADTVVAMGPWPIAAERDSAQSLAADLDGALAAPQFTMPVVEVKPEPPVWVHGKLGEARHIGLGEDSGILAVITAVIVLIMISYRSCRRLFVNLSQELWGMRKRNNAFDEHTSNETQVLVLMAVQWSVSIGILMYSYFHIAGLVSGFDAFADLMKIVGLFAAYYAVQVCVYWMLGYTFATPEGCRSFLQGFTSAQTFLGLGLLVPSLVAIFYPTASALMVQIGIILYILARIVFICKGFRIFYQNFGTLLYFILYLCTLEIIPLILVYKLALKLVGSDLV